MLMAHALLPRLIEAGSGHIVMVGSLSGLAPTARQAVYNGTKFGLRGFTLGLREDLRGTGVSASLVAPGFVREAGMFADSKASTPPGMGTASPAAGRRRGRRGDREGPGRDRGRPVPPGSGRQVRWPPSRAVGPVVEPGGRQGRRRGRPRPDRQDAELIRPSRSTGSTCRGRRIRARGSLRRPARSRGTGGAAPATWRRHPSRTPSRAPRRSSSRLWRRREGPSLRSAAASPFVMSNMCEFDVSPAMPMPAAPSLFRWIFSAWSLSSSQIATPGSTVPSPSSAS